VPVARGCDVEWDLERVRSLVPVLELRSLVGVSDTDSRVKDRDALRSTLGRDNVKSPVMFFEPDSEIDTGL
jgi:hypothetical protein